MIITFFKRQCDLLADVYVHAVCMLYACCVCAVCRTMNSDDKEMVEITDDTAATTGESTVAADPDGQESFPTPADDESAGTEATTDESAADDSTVAETEGIESPATQIDDTIAPTEDADMVDVAPKQPVVKSVPVPVKKTVAAKVAPTTKVLPKATVPVTKPPVSKSTPLVVAKGGIKAVTANKEAKQKSAAPALLTSASTLPKASVLKSKASVKPLPKAVSVAASGDGDDNDDAAGDDAAGVIDDEKDDGDTELPTVPATTRAPPPRAAAIRATQRLAVSATAVMSDASSSKTRPKPTSTSVTTTVSATTVAARARPRAKAGKTSDNTKEAEETDCVPVDLWGGLMHELPEHYTRVVSNSEYDKLDFKNLDVVLEHLMLVPADKFQIVPPLDLVRLQYEKQGAGRYVPFAQEEEYLAAQARRDEKYPKVTARSKKSAAATTGDEDGDTDVALTVGIKKGPRKGQYLTGKVFGEYIDSHVTKDGEKDFHTFGITYEMMNTMLRYNYLRSVEEKAPYDILLDKSMKWKAVRRGTSRNFFAEPEMPPIKSKTSANVVATEATSTTPAAKKAKTSATNVDLKHVAVSDKKTPVRRPTTATRTLDKPASVAPSTGARARIVPRKPVATRPAAAAAAVEEPADVNDDDG